MPALKSWKNRSKNLKEIKQKLEKSSPDEFEAYKKKLQKESPKEFEKLNTMLQPSNKLSEKRPSEVKNNKVSDPYAKENFIDRGDYYELSIPIGSICMIEKPSNVSRHYNLAKDYHKKCRAGGFSDWRLPTIDELEMIFKARPFKSVHGDFLSSSSYCYERKGYIDDRTGKVYDFGEYKVFCVR